MGHPEAQALDGTSSVIADVVAELELEQVDTFRSHLMQGLACDPLEEARRTSLYVTRSELGDLGAWGIEVGSHTWSHVRCRALDAAGCAREIGENVVILASAVDGPIRAFSVPYGHALDLTPEVRSAVRAAGHEAVFSVEGLPNPGRGSLDLDRIHRVSLTSESDRQMMVALEALPRLRVGRRRASRLGERIRRQAR